MESTAPREPDRAQQLADDHHRGGAAQPKLHRAESAEASYAGNLAGTGEKEGKGKWDTEWPLVSQINQLWGQIEDLKKELARAKPEKNPDIAAARAIAIREVVKLLPKAAAEARKGKPALLRLIVRSLR